MISRSGIMIFSTFVIASLGVLPTHASEPQAWDLSWVYKCGPSLDGQKRCAPDSVTGTPSYWLCNGKACTWDPTEQPCKHDARRDDAPSTPDGGWHIGCDETGHCGYYQDHYGKRFVKVDSVGSFTDPLDTRNPLPKPVIEETEEEKEEHTPAQVQEKLAQTECPVFTRCEPLDSGYNFVKYLRPFAMEWIRFYHCGASCVQFPDFAACEEHRDKYVVPMPPVSSLSVEAAARRHEQKSEIPQQPRQTPVAPGTRTPDTRCNPHDPSEVQRYNETEWTHHYRCTFFDSCIDIDGRGACRLHGIVYELPSANPTSTNQGEPIGPLRVRTSCNKSNASEVRQWKGEFPETLGVCIPPYECFDFSGGVNYALCVHPDAQYGTMWLPWPSLSRSPNSGQVTRCMGESTLEQFKDDAWITYKRCLGVFKCQTAVDGVNGGCAAPSLYDILIHGGVNAEEDAHPGTSFDSDRREKLDDVPLKPLTEQIQELTGEVEYGVKDIIDEVESEADNVINRAWDDILEILATILRPHENVTATHTN